MKDKQIYSTVDAMLSGMEISASEKEHLIQTTMEKRSVQRKGYARKVTFAIICALVLTSMLAHAVGIPMLRVFRKWTDDIYAVRVDMEKPMPGVFTAKEQPPEVARVWGQEIADALLDMNACAKLPKWIPERFQETFSSNVDWDEVWGGTINVEFHDESGKRLELYLNIYPEDGHFSSTTYYQHDNTENEVWTFKDVEYNFLKNYESYSVNWQEENCRASIYADMTRDEFYKMIKSIYE